VDRLAQKTLDRPEAGEDLVLASEVQELTEPQPRPDSPLLAVSRVLWRERVRVGKATLAGALIAAVIVLIWPSSYTATVQLMPPDGSELSGSMGILAQLMGSGNFSSGGSSSGGSLGGGSSSSLASGLGELLGGQKPGALFVGILGCRTVEDHLVDKFDLRKVYWRKTYKGAREKLESNTDIEEDKKTGIIKIEVDDHSQERAKGIAQAYVSELDWMIARVNTSSASREREFLEKRLVLVHKELDAAAKDLSEFSSKNAMMDPDDQSKAMMEATAVLQGQLIAAQSELSGLEEIYTDDNVRVRSAKANVAELQRQLNQIGGMNYSGSNALDPKDLYPSLRQLPILGAQYEELYRRAKIAETVLEMLTKEYELARVEEAKQTPTVKVLDAANPTEKPSWPPRKLFTAIGAFLGFVFGGCWVVAYEYWCELDPSDPNKDFLQGAWTDIQLHMQQSRSFFRSKLARLRGKDRADDRVS
jgi:uncharacterized protein involved in exopolysaccharide biosynthesis